MGPSCTVQLIPVEYATFSLDEAYAQGDSNRRGGGGLRWHGDAQTTLVMHEAQRLLVTKDAHVDRFGRSLRAAQPKRLNQQIALWPALTKA